MNRPEIHHTKLQQYISSEVRFYSAAKLKEEMGWSEKTINEMFADPEFPALTLGKTHLVEAHALINYCSVRREKKTIKRTLKGRKS